MVCCFGLAPLLDDQRKSLTARTVCTRTHIRPKLRLPCWSFELLTRSAEFLQRQPRCHSSTAQQQAACLLTILCEEPKVAILHKREFRVNVSDGTVLNSTWQVAGVMRPLMSVGEMFNAGSKVFLQDRNPRVVSAKGKVVPQRRAGNVFLIDLWV